MRDVARPAERHVARDIDIRVRNRALALGTGRRHRDELKKFRRRASRRKQRTRKLLQPDPAHPEPSASEINFEMRLVVNVPTAPVQFAVVHEFLVPFRDDMAVCKGNVRAAIVAFGRGRAAD